MSFKVAIKLANEMDTRGFVTIGHGQLARIASVSERTAQNVIKRFEQDKLLECVHRGGLNSAGVAGRGGSGQVNSYRALWKPYQSARKGAPFAPLPGENGESEHRSTVQTTTATQLVVPGEDPGGRPSPRSLLAFRGTRVDVPMLLHDDFLRRRNHIDAEGELQAWYAQVDREWTTGTHALHEPGVNMFRFWKAAYETRWPPAPAATKQGLVRDRNKARFLETGEQLMFFIRVLDESPELQERFREAIGALERGDRIVRVSRSEIANFRGGRDR